MQIFCFSGGWRMTKTPDSKQTRKLDCNENCFLWKSLANWMAWTKSSTVMALLIQQKTKMVN